jgi:hypothetical protein
MKQATQGWELSPGTRRGIVGTHKGDMSFADIGCEEEGIWSGQLGAGAWPANSLDLNPIEDLWHVLRANAKKRKPKVLRKEDLIAAIKEEWENMDIKVINRLIMSMRRRLKAVIKAEGGCTKY